MAKAFILSTFLFLIALNPNLAQAQPINKVEGAEILGGRQIEISAANKKALVVVFLSAECPCSNSHISELKSLYSEYEKDVAFVGIHSNVDEPEEQTKSYFKSAALPFPVIQDQSAKMADQFKALKTPHSFIISAGGETLYQGGVSSSKHFETADRKYLREALTDVHDGKKVRTPEGRTLGCAINRGEKVKW